MTGRATYNDTAQLRELWKLVFGDGDRFLDTFFGNLFRPDECLVTRDGERITSMLFMLEAVWSGRNEYPMSYIYACATHPDYRRRGLMGQLLEEAVRYAGKNGLELALVPEDEALAVYYGRFGFTGQTYLYMRKYPPLVAAKSSSDWLEVADNENSARLLTELRERFWKGKNAILWPEAHIRVTLDELSAQNGQFLVMKTGGRLPSGYALAIPDNGVMKILECASILPQDDTVTSLRNHYKYSTTLFSLSEGIADSCAETPYGLVYTRRDDKSPYFNLALDF